MTLNASKILQAFSFLLAFSFWPEHLMAEPAHSDPTTDDSATVTCTPHHLENRLRCSDKVMMENLIHDVSDWFVLSDYEKIDTEYERFCKGNDRFPNGVWYLSYFSHGLDYLFTNTPKPLIIINKIKSWQEQSPRSMAALYAEARYWRARALLYSRESPAVAATKNKTSHDLARKSLEIVERVGKAKNDCPGWSALEIDLLIELGESHEKIKPVFKKSIEKHPQYHEIYFAMASKYSPRNGGTVEEYQGFALEAARLTATFEGMGMYSRIFWLQDFTNGIPFSADSQSPPYWHHLNKGYADLTRIYPLSMDLAGKYVDIACRGGTKDLYHQLRKKIEGAEWLAPMFHSIDICDMRHGWRQ